MMNFLDACRAEKKFAPPHVHILGNIGAVAAILLRLWVNGDGRDGLTQYQNAENLMEI
ncbi:hypothetical protein J5N58_03435 [Rhizobium cremeum]|uniref:hypothetical protein n=1 Tax=Rhizobium cremeum TaxID=2813827 RepID=UPI001FD1DCC0|nr:hypothetical protein [Rhizobium cremeum]MCJ7993664.1 hypothetical protein [Rhizobium cremeum]MCJ7998721.1 hypothetical protein [Rhizobium cremeum]